MAINPGKRPVGTSSGVGIDRLHNVVKNKNFMVAVSWLSGSCASKSNQVGMTAGQGLWLAQLSSIPASVAAE
eukprot:gene2147-biopygen1289